MCDKVRTIFCMNTCFFTILTQPRNYKCRNAQGADGRQKRGDSLGIFIDGTGGVAHTTCEVAGKERAELQMHGIVLPNPAVALKYFSGEVLGEESERSHHPENLQTTPMIAVQMFSQKRKICLQVMSTHFYLCFFS
jgi:hypothetical protein